MARDRILRTPSFRPPADPGWQPLLDIYELKEGWLLKADVAGVRPEDISILLDGRFVTIRGLRRDWAVEEGCCHYRMEISYSRFERTVELPAAPDPHSVRTELKDGMLLVRLRREAAS
jgi:HSP20 family protein